jgi:hypothetical protein
MVGEEGCQFERGNEQEVAKGIKVTAAAGLVATGPDGGDLGGQIGIKEWELGECGG